MFVEPVAFMKEMKGFSKLIARMKAVVELMTANRWNEIHRVGLVLIMLVESPIRKFFSSRLITSGLILVAL